MKRKKEERFEITLPEFSGCSLPLVIYLYR